MVLQAIEERLQGIKVTAPAKAAYLTNAYRGEHGCVAESLTGVDVGQMDLDCWQTDGADGISQGDGGMSIAAGIDDNSACPVQCILNGVDEDAFMVGLSHAD